jgi:Protein of unknown function (DUF4232)
MMSVMTSPECEPEDLEFALTWTPAGRGLTGRLQARNVGQRACRLSGKPVLVPLAPDGTELAAQTVITLELRAPGYVLLGPGDSAVADVGWAGWNGPPASGRMLVRWPGGQQDFRTAGPPQPEPAPDGATNLWSSWFTPSS